MNVLLPFEAGVPILRQASPGSDLWGTVPAWLAAVGTILAVLFALYLNLLRANRRRPELSLDYQSDGEMDLAVTAVLQVAPGNWASRTLGAYLRFRVANAQGKEAAEDVEVVISSITKGSTSPQLLSISNIPLVWSNMEPGTTTRRIPGGTQRYIDVLSIVVPAGAESMGFGGPTSGSEPESPPEPLTMDLQITPAPISDLHKLQPGDYTIRLEVTGRNADATRWETKIEFDGKWTEPTKAPSGFTVTKPSRIRRKTVR